jgi:hypothetical protein
MAVKVRTGYHQNQNNVPGKIERIIIFELELTGY